MEPCSGSEGSEDIRNEIAPMRPQQNLRSFEFTSGEPVVWRPHEVINPESGLPFTDISAWHFIADQAEKGCPLQSISMRKPSGSTGHVIRPAKLAGKPSLFTSKSPCEQAKSEAAASTTAHRRFAMRTDELLIPPNDSDAFQCSECDSTKVSTQLQSHRFKYGAGDEATEIGCVLPVRVCADCGG